MRPGWFDRGARYDQILDAFLVRARRDLEKKEYLPGGWVGRYTDAYGPRGERVHFSSRAWTVSLDGERVSRHDSRRSAFLKARKLYKR